MDANVATRYLSTEPCLMSRTFLAFVVTITWLSYNKTYECFLSGHLTGPFLTLSTVPIPALALGGLSFITTTSTTKKQILVTVSSRVPPRDHSCHCGDF